MLLRMTGRAVPESPFAFLYFVADSAIKSDGLAQEGEVFGRHLFSALLLSFYFMFFRGRLSAALVAHTIFCLAAFRF